MDERSAGIKLTGASASLAGQPGVNQPVQLPEEDMEHGAPHGGART